MMFVKKRAITKYAKLLPSALNKRYGSKGPFTVAQVQATVRDYKLSQKHIAFAYLMLCDQQQLQDHIDEISKSRLNNYLIKAIGVNAGEPNTCLFKEVGSADLSDSAGSSD